MSDSDFENFYHQFLANLPQNATAIVKFPKKNTKFGFAEV